MLEIVLLIVLCKTLGNQLRAKGRKPFWLQFMLVIAWFAGEVAGAFVAGVVEMLRYGEDAQMGLGVYLFAIAGAALGAGLTFLFAYALPPSSAMMNDDSYQRDLDSNNPYARNADDRRT